MRRFFAGLFCLGSMAHSQPAEPRHFYINYSSKPPADDLLRYDLCILDPQCQADLKPGKARGTRFLAYLSAVEVAGGSPAHQSAIARGVRFLGENADWASQLMEVGSEAWHQHLIHDVAAMAIQAGYDGLFIDTLDSASLLPGNDRQLAARSALIKLLREIRRRWPKLQIVINRGFELVPEVKSIIQGVLVESVYQSFDPARKRYKAVTPEDSQWVEARIRDLQAAKLTVYTVDYVSPAKGDLAAQTAERLKRLGTIPLITTPELRGRVLAPIAEE